MSLTSICFAIFIFIGVVVAGFGVRAILQARESSRWPSVPGIIQSSSVERSSGTKGGTTYKPKIKYTYSVAGTEYTGNLIAFGLANVSAGGKFAEEYIQKYPKGKNVQVFYSPTDCKTSVLEHGLTKRSFVLFAFGIMFAAMGLCFAAMTWLLSP